MATLTTRRAAPGSFPSRTRQVGRRETPKAVLPPVAEVHETPTDLVIRIRLQQGALELSVPKRALCESHEINTHHIPGSNPDATPC
jgi:hypothetical protein